MLVFQLHYFVVWLGGMCTRLTTKTHQTLVVVALCLLDQSTVANKPKGPCYLHVHGSRCDEFGFVKRAADAPAWPKRGIDCWKPLVDSHFHQ